MNYKIVFYFSSFLLIGFLLAAGNASAQTIGYRQSNLASSLPNIANNVEPTRVNPWGIGFLSSQPFFIADHEVGRVTALDATGFGVRPGSFIVPDAATLSNGSAAVNVSFADTGVHAITAQYSGDRVFLPVSERTPLQVTGLATTVTLTAPTSAGPGSTIILTANINSSSGVPTGQATFLDGNNSLGASSLDGSGAATLRNNTLAAGTHALTASYDGDGKFGASKSAVVTLDIANPDFSVGAAPPAASVIAGQSTQFMVTLTPGGGFAGNVTFSCLPVSGITCTFSPATVTPANGLESTRLTVATSASVSRYGAMPTFDTIGP